MNFEQMTVKELREESKKRGLTLESHGKRFTKAELIENIKKWEEEQKQIEDELDKELRTEHYEPEELLTVEEIEERYGGRKKQNVYDNFLDVNSGVVFVAMIDLPNGETIKKLRTAKVKFVNRDDEVVIVETIVGDEFGLSFDDLIYIRPDIEKGGYPRVIRNILRAQRTEKGRQMIQDRMDAMHG